MQLFVEDYQKRLLEFSISIFLVSSIFYASNTLLLIEFTNKIKKPFRAPCTLTSYKIVTSGSIWLYTMLSIYKSTVQREESTTADVVAPYIERYDAI